MIVRAHHRLTPRRIAIIAAVLLLTLVSGRIITQTVWASSSVSRSGQHVLRIYDDGSEKGVLTEADTLREALEAAGVTLDQNDITEPALDSELVAAAYDVNIYRARPVMVVDGETTTKVITPYRTAKQIAKQADIELRTEDKIQVEHGGDVVLEGALERMVIDRAHEVTLVFYGEKTTLYTHADTVGQLLSDRNITIGADDTLSVASSAPIVPGMTIEIWRDGVQTVTETEPIQRPIREIKDTDRELGFREVRTEGADGERRVTYEVTMKNGQEVDRKEISSVTITEPTEQVVVVGAKSRFAPYTGGGNKDQWLTAAGIPREMWGYADSIVQRESGWNPNATNRSSGACGLAQALPCSKVPGNPYDPVDSLIWMNGYVNGRYGGWEGAYNFWQRNHWY